MSIERLSVVQPTINNELISVKGKARFILLTLAGVCLLSSSADLLEIVM
ncbi:hypothetical protein [Psychrobacter sp. JCM 18901]|nr:hypothetical protein [Psychrobacter sp. JCM 18901]